MLRAAGANATIVRKDGVSLDEYIAQLGFEDVKRAHDAFNTSLLSQTPHDPPTPLSPAPSAPPMLPQESSPRPISPPAPFSPPPSAPPVNSQEQSSDSAKGQCQSAWANRVAGAAVGAAVLVAAQEGTKRWRKKEPPATHIASVRSSDPVDGDIALNLR